MNVNINSRSQISKENQIKETEFDLNNKPEKEAEINEERESPKKIPLDKQIDSKDWNIRKNCYLNILQNLEETSEENFAEILNSQVYSKTDDLLINYLPKIAEDNLPQSLEIGLDVIINILKIDEKGNNHIIEEEVKFNIMKSILDKSIFSIKSSCKEKSKEIINILFEFNLNLIERYMGLFAKIFESNKSKSITTAINIVKELIVNFGMEEFSLEFISGHINKLLENTNIGVRSETINLVKEIYLFKRKDFIKHIKFNKESIKKEMESVFKKLDAEKIPEVTRKIKPAKFLGQKKEKNIFSLRTIEEKKEICKEFLNKYKFLECVESFNFDSVDIDQFLIDLENLNLNQKSFFDNNNNNSNPNENFEQLYDKIGICCLFNIINSSLKLEISQENNNNKNFNLIKTLDLLEKIYEILIPFKNQENNNDENDLNINELYILIINNIVIKYIELEYLNNPNLYSKKTKNKFNSISSSLEFSIEESKRFAEKKINLLNNYLDLVFFIIERITFASYLEIIMMEEDEKENITYMKLNLLIKINEKIPPENLEDNLGTLLEIYLQNMDKNVKIDTILITCIKKLMNFFGKKFNQKLKDLNNDGIVIQINEFIKNNIELKEENEENNFNSNNNIKEKEREITVGKKNNKENDINNNGENLIESNINKENFVKKENKEVKENKDNKEIKEYKEKEREIKVNNNNPYSNPFNVPNPEIINEIKKPVLIEDNFNSTNSNNIQNKKNEKEKEKEIPNNNIDKPIETKEAKNPKDDELIVIDMFDNNENKKPKKNIPNRFKKFSKKAENENANEENNNDNFVVMKDSEPKEKENPIDSNIIEVKMDKKVKEENPNAIKIEKEKEKNVKKEKENFKEKDKEQKNEIENNANFVEEEIDPQKKKEKDLAAFEKMLEEQMLAESKKMEEKGIDPNKNNKKPIVKKGLQKMESKATLNNLKVDEKELKENNSKTISSKVISKAPSKTIDLDDEDDQPGKMKSDEVETFINSIIGPEISELLNSEKWNERKDGFVMLNDFIRENSNNNSIKNNVDNLISFLKLKLKGFKETNFNILREIFNIFSELIKNFAQKKIFEKRHVTMILKAYWDKMSDSKVKENLTNLYLTMMEYFTPTFVLGYFFKQPDKSKTNPILKEYAILIEKCVDEFGIENLPIKDIVEICKFMSGNSNPQIRNSSTSLLCVLYKFVGKDLKVLLKDIKEATFKLIEVELDKVEVISEKKVAKRNIINTDNETKGNNKDKSSKNVNDILFARVDISKKLTPKLLKELNEGKWGEKKKASEDIEKILMETNNKILPNGLNDIFLTVFKARLNDSNKNVVRLMVQILTKIIEALGPNFKQMPNSVFKNITPLLVGNLADKMLLLREDVLLCMEKWTLNAGIENILSHIPEHLKNENTDMRADLFKFLGKFRNLIEKNSLAQQNLKEFCGPLLKCLQDRIQQIRTMAEDFILFTLKYVNISIYQTGIKDMKPAIQNDLKKILDNIQIIHLENEAQALQNNMNTSNNNIVNNKSNENLNNMNKNFSSEAINQNQNSDKNNNNNNNNIISVIKTNVTNTKNNSESGNDYMNLSELKQDSIISGNNRSTINNDDLKTNSQVLSTNKNNSKRSINSSTNKVNRPNNNNMDKSAEKKRVTESKTPEIKMDNNPYNSKATSNFEDKAKTPNPGPRNQQKNKKEKEEKVRTFTNEDDNNATNLSSNSMIINSSTNKYESKSPRPNVAVRPSTKKKAALQSWEIFQNQICLKFNKEKRFEVDKKNKFNLENPSDDYIKKLKEQLSEVFVQEYYKKLISDEIKHNVEAVNLLINYIEEFAIQTEFSIVEYLDIFLKWIIWKVNSNQNPSIVKALLELFDLIGEVFLRSESNTNQNLRINDIESYIIINVLCEKLGNNNEKIRDQARDILLDKYLNSIISVSKFTSELCNLISNLNKPTKLRSECIEIINYLFKESENNCAIFTLRDIKSLVKAYVNSKSTDANKNKIQDFIFTYFYQTDENYLIYLNDFDLKTKDAIKQKLSKWAKNQENTSTNAHTIKVNNNNHTPRLNKNNNDNKNYNNKDFETMNKSDDNISLNSKSPSVIKGNSIKIEKKNSKVENVIDNNNNDSREMDYNYIEENPVNDKIIKSKNINYKIQNANIENNNMINDNNNNFHTPKRDSSSKINNNIINQKNSKNNINNKSSMLNSQIINSSIQNSNLDNSIMNTNTNLDPKKKTYMLEDKEDLFTILDTLNNGNEAEKVNTILIIHDIIHAKFEASKHILIPNIDEIIKAFIIALKKLFEKANSNLNEIPIKLGKYLITVLYKISSNKELIKNISISILFNLTEEVLSNLIIENLDKIGDNQEGIVIIRSLNSTMLRLLENCDYTQVIEMLLDIVMKYKNSFEKSKISGLGIKCLLKIHQILEQIVNSIKLDKLLLKIHLIFCEFDRMNNGGLESENQTDQMIIRFIKNFIYEIVKIKREGIVGDYRLVERHSDKDKYIKKWIKSILASLNNNNDNNDFSTEMKGITVKKMDKSDSNSSRNDSKKISVSPLKKNMNSYHNNSNYNNVRNTINIDRDLSGDKLFKNNSGSRVNQNLRGDNSNNNLGDWVEYKNKLKNIKERDVLNHSQMNYDSKYPTNLSSDENPDLKRERKSSANNETPNFLNQINKIKQKWEKFSNNSRIPNSNISGQDFNRTTMNVNRSNIEGSTGQSSTNTLKELKKKWNQVSRPKPNLNHSSINDNNSNYLNESMTNRTSSIQGDIKSTRKSLKK